MEFDITELGVIGRILPLRFGAEEIPPSALFAGATRSTGSSR